MQEMRFLIPFSSFLSSSSSFPFFMLWDPHPRGKNGTGQREQLARTTACPRGALRLGWGVLQRWPQSWLSYSVLTSPWMWVPWGQRCDTALVSWPVSGDRLSRRLPAAKKLGDKPSVPKGSLAGAAQSPLPWACRGHSLLRGRGRTGNRGGWRFAVSRLQRVWWGSAGVSNQRQPAAQA